MFYIKTVRRNVKRTKAVVTNVTRKNVFRKKVLLKLTLISTNVLK